MTTEDKNLDVREDKNAGIVIAGLTEVDVKGLPEVMALLKVKSSIFIIDWQQKSSQRGN